MSRHRRVSTGIRVRFTCFLDCVSQALDVCGTVWFQTRHESAVKSTRRIMLVVHRYNLLDNVVGVKDLLFGPCRHSWWIGEVATIANLSIQRSFSHPTPTTTSMISNGSKTRSRKSTSPTRRLLRCFPHKSPSPLTWIFDYREAQLAFIYIHMALRCCL